MLIDGGATTEVVAPRPFCIICKTNFAKRDKRAEKSFTYREKCSDCCKGIEVKFCPVNSCGKKIRLDRCRAHISYILDDKNNWVKVSKKKCVKCLLVQNSEEFKTNKGQGRVSYSATCRTCRNDIGRKTYGVYENVVRHGITTEQYDEIYKSQGSCCAVCGFVETKIMKTGLPKRLAIHHDHRCCPGKYSCGKCVIALLCSNCNTGIGLLQDSPDVIFKAFKLMSDFVERNFAITYRINDDK
jgi:Autographiviridae endonuclease VII